MTEAEAQRRYYEVPPTEQRYWLKKQSLQYVWLKWMSVIFTN